MLSFMEHKNPSKTLALRALLLLLLVSTTPKPLLSQPLHSDPIFSQSQSQPPTPSTTTAAAAHSSTPLRRVLLGILFGSLTGLFAAIALLLLIRLFLFYADRTPILRGPVVFSPRISSPKSLQLLLSSQCQPSQLLGSSPVGRYYRLLLDDELTVAVKILHSDCPSASQASSSSSSKRRAQRELQLLSKVEHRNVMSLRAYVRDSQRLSLVYDYCPCGSLEDAMKRVRSQQLSMGWEVRHRIAVGIAKGLRYLHFECTPRILQHGLKPSNVLLDEQFEPRLADCGLPTIVAATGTVVAAASNFYTAPECFQGCRYTDKSDIYSFGMILSVLLTGRDPSDPFFATEAGRGSLGCWLRHLQQAGEAREALDKGILGEEVEQDEMLMAIRIALVCHSDLPADRPSSDELVAMLTQLHSF